MTQPPAVEVTVVGVDGAPDGWAVVERSPDGRLGGSLVDRLDGLVARVRRGEVAVVAIDMPIGLLDVHPRTADVEARRLLGPRRASVFATPLRCCINAASYPEARATSRESAGTAPSKQAWNLMGRIRELDRLIRADDPIYEAHPELAFLRLAEQPLNAAKTKGAGIQQRRRLLINQWGAEAYADLLAQVAAPEPDIADALALVGTAAHIAAGSEIILGDQRDEDGRRAQMRY